MPLFFRGRGKMFKLGALRWLLRLYPNATNPTTAPGRNNTTLWHDARQLSQGVSFTVVDLIYVEPDKAGSYTKSAYKRAARVRACNYVKFETGRNLPLLLKIVTCPARTLR